MAFPSASSYDSSFTGTCCTLAFSGADRASVFCGVDVQEIEEGTACAACAFSSGLCCTRAGTHFVDCAKHNSQALVVVLIFLFFSHVSFMNNEQQYTFHISKR